MIVPRQSDDVLLADIQQARSDAGRAHVWWLGQSGFLIQIAGRHLLFDPYLSDALTRKYASTDKPHVRMSQRVVAPAKLGFVDVVTSSHNHTDHLDAETLVPILEANPDVQLLVPAANRSFAAQRLNVPADRLRVLDAGEHAEIAGFTVHALPAAHEDVERDDDGRCRYLGYVAERGGFTVYHSGDTVWYDELADYLRRWPIDLALLPINGRGAERRVAGNLWGREAAQLAARIKARLVVPCHYDLFTFNTASPDEFVQTARQLDQAHRVLELGERLSLDKRPVAR